MRRLPAAGSTMASTPRAEEGAAGEELSDVHLHGMAFQACAQRAEAGADLVDQHVGPLQRGEVPAAVELAPVDDVPEALFGPAARAAEDLLREQADAGGHLHRVAADLGEALPVQPRRRGGAVRQPVQHHLVEQLVARQHVLGVAVAVHPGLVLLHHPGRLAGGRIGQAVAQRLRPRALLARIARALGAVALHAGQRRLLGRRQVGHRRRVGRDDAASSGGCPGMRARPAGRWRW